MSKQDVTQETHQEIIKKILITTEIEREYMEIGDLDLDGLEASCSDKTPTHIPPQQVSLLEKEIIKENNMKFLGITSESLKDPDGKK